MNWKQLIIALVLMIALGAFAFQPVMFMVWGGGLYAGLGTAAIIVLVPAAFISFFTRKRWRQFSRGYWWGSVVIFSLLATPVLYFTYWQLPGWQNYSKRKAITQPLTNIKADFNLATTNFGKVSQNASTVGLVFSPDGTKVAYSEYSDVGGKHVQQAYIVDAQGKKAVGDPYETVVGLAFSRDSRHLAYNAWRKQDGIQWGTLVIDGQVQGWEKGFGPKLGLDYVEQNTIAEEAKGKSCPNINMGRKELLEGSVQFITINGHKSREHFIVEPLVYSSDCQRVAFVIQRNLTKVVIVGDGDGNFKEASKPMDYNEAFRLPQFSADGKVVAYGGTDEEKNIWWVVENTSD